MVRLHVGMRISNAALPWTPPDSPKPAPSSGNARKRYGEVLALSGSIGRASPPSRARFVESPAPTPPAGGTACANITPGAILRSIDEHRVVVLVPRRAGAQKHQV